MNLLTAIQRLRSLLDIEEEDDRYPNEVAKLHVNQAIASIAKGRDLEISHAVYSGSLLAGSSTISVSDIESSQGCKVLSILKIWRHPYGEDNVIDEAEYAAMIDTYAETEGVVAAVALVGRTLHFRPIPEGDTTLRLLLRTRPADLSEDADTNHWMETLEHEVLSRAAGIASIWLLEEQRAPGFFQLAEAELNAAALVDSQRVDGTLQHMEEFS
jgi:hypothetical protein